MKVIHSQFISVANWVLFSQVKLINRIVDFAFGIHILFFCWTFIHIWVRLCRLQLSAVYSHSFTVHLLLDPLNIDDYSQLILGSHTTVIFIVPLHYFFNSVIRYIASLLFLYWFSYFYQTYTALCAGNFILPLLNVFYWQIYYIHIHCCRFRYFIGTSVFFACWAEDTKL